MKNMKLISVYMASIGIATVIYISFFWTSFLSDETSLFYRAAALLALTAVVLFATLFFGRFFKVGWLSLLFIQDIFLVCLLFVSINWQVYGLIPFNSTRSNSIILLDYLYWKDGVSVSKDNVEEYVKRVYFSEYDSIGVRLDEQEKTGNIRAVDGGWVITEKGRKVARAMDFITNLYNPSRSYFIHVDKN